MKRIIGSLLLVSVFACQCEEETRVANTRLDVSPTYIDFGGVPMGTLDTRIVELRSLGSGPVAIDRVSFRDDGETRGFALVHVLKKSCEEQPRADEKRLAPGECAQLVIGFKPRQPGPADAKVRIISDDESRATIDLEIKGEGLPAIASACALDADHELVEADCTRADEGGAFVVPKVDFGSVTRRELVARRVRIGSLGRATLNVSKISLAPGSVGFALPDNELAPIIAGGDTFDVTVEFTPPAKGSFTGTLVIESDDYEHPRIELPLAGKGTAPAVKVCVLGADGALEEGACTRLDETPAFKPVIELAPTPLGSESQRSIRVLNVGEAPLVVKSAELQSTTAALSMPLQLEPRTLAPGESVDATFAFKPRQEGVAAGLFALTTDDDAHPRLELEVKSLATSAVLKICALRDDGAETQDGCSRLRDTPAYVPAMDFGVAPWGTRQVRLLRITNVGLAELQLSRVVMTTANQDLSLGAGVDAGVLAPGAVRDVEVVFVPQIEAAVEGSIQIVANDAISPVVNVVVKGVSQGPRLCLQPDTELDFGDVPVNSTRRLPVQVRNCGLVAFDVGSWAITEPDMANRRFAFGTVPALPQRLETGGSATIELAFTPRSQVASTATLTVNGGPRTVTLALKGKGAPSLCDASPTVANPGPDLTARPLDTVTLNGSASTSPRGGALTYAWRLANQPQNGTSSIQGSGARPSLWAQLAGTYVVELTVKDSQGCQSAPRTMTVRVVPNKRIHVQLTWAQDFGDIDLHFVRPGGSAFSSTDDVYFMNKTPSWGATLDIDEIWGNGPENVNHNTPVDGTYKVYGHYYCSRECFLFICSSSKGAATATIKVFIDGVEKGSSSATLTQRDLWNPFDIVVSGGGARIDVTARTGAIPKADQGCTGSGS